MVRVVLIVTGSIQARPESIDKVRRSALRMCAAPREPGCLFDSVHHDVEDPLRLVFLEQWVDEDALQHTFECPSLVHSCVMSQPLPPVPPDDDLHGAGCVH